MSTTKNYVIPAAFAVLLFLLGSTAAFADHSFEAHVSKSRAITTSNSAETTVTVSSALTTAGRTRLQGLLDEARTELAKLVEQLDLPEDRTRHTHMDDEHDDMNDDHDMGDGHDDDDMGHSHTMPINVDPENAPTLEIKVHEDPKSGWNVELITTNYTFAPEHASTEHVEGEGHAHLYVDEVKINRVYGHWYHLATLGDPGEHTIRVELSANSHNPLAVEGEIIEDSETITVE